MSVSWRILQGDCREVLASLDAGSVLADQPLLNQATEAAG